MARAIKRLTPILLQSIIAKHVLGLTASQISRATGSSITTVNRAIQKYKQEVQSRELNNVTSELAGTWKEELADLAINCLKSALARDRMADPEYALKAAPIATSVLKGVGQFSDTQLIGVQISLAPPSGWSSHYLNPVSTKLIGVETQPQDACNSPIDITPESEPKPAETGESG